MATSTTSNGDTLLLGGNILPDSATIDKPFDQASGDSDRETSDTADTTDDGDEGAERGLQLETARRPSKRLRAARTGSPVSDAATGSVITQTPSPQQETKKQKMQSAHSDVLDGSASEPDEDDDDEDDDEVEEGHEDEGHAHDDHDENSQRNEENVANASHENSNVLDDSVLIHDDAQVEQEEQENEEEEEKAEEDSPDAFPDDNTGLARSRVAGKSLQCVQRAFQIYQRERQQELQRKQPEPVQRQLSSAFDDADSSDSEDDIRSKREGANRYGYDDGDEEKGANNGSVDVEDSKASVATPHKNANSPTIGNTTPPSVVNARASEHESIRDSHAPESPSIAAILAAVTPSSSRNKSAAGAVGAATLSAEDAYFAGLDVASEARAAARDATTSHAATDSMIGQETLNRKNDDVATTTGTFIGKRLIVNRKILPDPEASISSTESGDSARDTSDTDAAIHCEDDDEHTSHEGIDSPDHVHRRAKRVRAAVSPTTATEADKPLLVNGSPSPQQEAKKPKLLATARGTDAAGDNPSEMQDSNDENSDHSDDDDSRASSSGDDDDTDNSSNTSGDTPTVSVSEYGGEAQENLTGASANGDRTLPRGKTLLYMRRAFLQYQLQLHQEQQQHESVQRQPGRTFDDVANSVSDDVYAHDANKASGTGASDVCDVNTHLASQSSTRKVCDDKIGDDGDHQLGANGNVDESDTDAGQATNDALAVRDKKASVATPPTEAHRNVCTATPPRTPNARGGDRESTHGQDVHVPHTLSPSFAALLEAPMPSGMLAAADAFFANGANAMARSALAYVFQNVGRTHSLENVDRVVARIHRVESAISQTIRDLGLDATVAHLITDDWVRAVAVDFTFDDSVSEYGFVLAAMLRVLDGMKPSDRPDAITAFTGITTARLRREIGRADAAVHMTRDRVIKPEGKLSLHAYSHALCLRLDIGDWSDVVRSRARLASLLHITRGEITVVVAAVAFHVAQAVHEEKVVQLDDVYAAAIGAGRALGQKGFPPVVNAIRCNRVLVFHGLDGVLAPHAPAATV